MAGNNRQERLSPEEERYLKGQLLATGFRTPPEKVIAVCKAATRGEPKGSVAEHLGLDPDTVSSITEQWKDGKLSFLNPWVLPTGRLISDEDGFKLWLSERLRTVIDAVTALKAAISGFAWHDPEASVPEMGHLTAVHQAIIQGIKARSPLLQSSLDQWHRQAIDCLNSARLLRERFAKQLRGQSPVAMESQWARLLVMASARPDFDFPFTHERQASARINLRWGAWGLAVDVTEPEAQEYETRFRRLLRNARAPREGENASKEIEGLRKEGNRLATLGRQMGDHLDSWIRP